MAEDHKRERLLMIALDGPSASGKSVVGSLLAQRLGYCFVDTGVMYRAVTWLALQRGISLADEEALTRLMEETSIRVVPLPGQNNHLGAISIDNIDITAVLRLPEVDRNVSLVSRVKSVRRAMVRQQRRIAADGGVVMAGRDIGTVVLPNADLKVFLEASPEKRAERRYREIASRGEALTYDEVLADLKRRDRLDSERDLSPLRPAPDAKTINTDEMTVEQVVDTVLAMVEEVK